MQTAIVDALLGALVLVAMIYTKPELVDLNHHDTRLIARIAK